MGFAEDKLYFMENFWENLKVTRIRNRIQFKHKCLVNLKNFRNKIKVKEYVKKVQPKDE